MSSLYQLGHHEIYSDTSFDQSGLSFLCVLLFKNYVAALAYFLCTIYHIPSTYQVLNDTQHMYTNDTYLFFSIYWDSTELLLLEDNSLIQLSSWANYRICCCKKYCNFLCIERFQDLRRDLQAVIGTRANINIAQIEDYGGETFLSEEVAIALLQETKLAFQRCQDVSLKRGIHVRGLSIVWQFGYTKIELEGAFI